MIDSKYRKYVIIVIVQTLLITNMAYALTLLPCTPKCGSSSNDESEHHHNKTHLAEDSDHNMEVMKIIDKMMSCNSCEHCEDVYTALLLSLITPDKKMSIIEATSIADSFKLNVNGHIPDPYRTPPA